MLMTPPPSSAAATESIIAVLEAHTGQQVAPNRSWRIDTALKPLLRELGMTTLDQLALALKSRRDSTLPVRIAEALLNHETSFFRDGGVLQQVVDAAIALHHDAPGRRLRLWSIGCSTGQEPLSLAMLFTECEAAGAMPFPEMIATDVSSKAIQRAQAGRYSQFEIQRGLPVTRMIQYFSQDGAEWVAEPNLVRRIRYRRHHIASPGDSVPAGRFDIILCRNVLMYFAPELRVTVFDRIAAALRPDGLVVLGAGETVIGQTDKLKPSQAVRGFYQPG